MSAWFKPKRYGYGNVPSTWQGWAATAAFGAFVVGAAAAAEHGAIPMLWALGGVAAATAAFISFAKYKTDGEWRCGKER